MGQPLLTISATVQCPHGGQGKISPSQTVVKAGSAVCTEADQVTITGCSFTIGPTPSPCVSVQWQSASTSCKAGGTAILTTGSQGLCLNAASAPQGPVVLGPAQSSAVAT
jgi:hypothetical protein